MRFVAVLCPDTLGSYSAPPDLLTVIRGREGRVGNREGRKGGEGRDMKG